MSYHLPRHAGARPVGQGLPAADQWRLHLLFFSLFLLVFIGKAIYNTDLSARKTKTKQWFDNHISSLSYTHTPIVNLLRNFLLRASAAFLILF